MEVIEVTALDVTFVDSCVASNDESTFTCQSHQINLQFTEGIQYALSFLIEKFFTIRCSRSGWQCRKCVLHYES